MEEKKEKKGKSYKLKTRQEQKLKGNLQLSIGIAHY